MKSLTANASESRYVRRVLSLAFLAPKIVEVIAAGSQPAETHR
jgi:hypothetical protein